MKTNDSLIVCGTDFSAAAEEAAHTAAALAHRMGAKLLLVHAAESDGDGDAAEDLRKTADGLRTSGAQIDQLIVDGAPDQALGQVAVERHARLIVVGAMGRSHRLLTGNIATRVAESAAVPTLVVRHGDWIARWAECRHPLRIVAADDLSLTGMAALRFLGEFAKLAPCDITVAHVEWPPEERTQFETEGPISFSEDTPEVERAMRLKLRERTRAAFGDRECVLRVVPRGGGIDASFTHVASEARADLIVLGTHQRRLAERMRLGSVSRAILASAHVNVLVVPPTPEATNAIPVEEGKVAAAA